MKLAGFAVIAAMLLCSCARDSGQERAATAQSPENRLNAVTVIDKPKDGETVHQTMEVAGWALIPDGTRSVTVTIDDNISFPAQINIPRADVAQAYPQYKNATAGWSVNIPLADVTPGQHHVAVAALSKAGKTIGISSFKVNVK